MKKIIFIILLLGCVYGTYAQEAYDQYRIIIDTAEENYNIGRLDEAEKELIDNIKKFPSNLRQSAYRLLALCSLGNDDEVLAEERTRLLLEENPYYSTSANDPQRFIDMVERIKGGISSVITTASSQAENLNEVPVPITLITEEMIRNSGARNLQEVLATYVPGMHIVDGNDDINIAMRGLYSNSQEKILIMLNGHRMNSFCTNIAPPDFSISLDKLKQIEVLRGPASSLYGGVSLTAVVNLITKQGADLDGIQIHGGVGNYGQWKGDAMIGKRYFDVDFLLWASIYTAKGEKRYVEAEDTGLGLYAGDAILGGVGNKPSYDVGLSLKYKNLQFLYNTQFSQITAPLTTTYLFSHYDIEKYHTFNGIRPSYATNSHHASLSYGDKVGNVWLKGTVTFDNSDLTHYQVIAEEQSSAIVSILPLPETIKPMMDGKSGMFRYINGQESTIGAKFQLDWSYINTKDHKGLLSYGNEFSYFKLNDVRYTFGYDYLNVLPENDTIAQIGRGSESNFNVFLQMKHQWKSFILNAGLRFDYKNRYDDSHISEFSPRLALIYMQPKWNLKFSYSKSFIDAPYLYRKSNEVIAGFLHAKELATELTPESLHSWQLTFNAVEWFKGLNFEVNGFYNQGRNLIYLITYEHANSGDMDTYGVEFSGNYKIHNFSTYLNATWIKTSKNHILVWDLDHPINTPEWMANAVLVWSPIKNLKLHTHLSYYGKQKAFYLNIMTYNNVTHYTELYTIAAEEYYINPTPENKQKMEALYKELKAAEQDAVINKEYGARILVNLGANYKLGNLEFGLNVYNLFNKRYWQSGMSTGLIPQKGRWFMFDITYKI